MIGNNTNDLCQSLKISISLFKEKYSFQLKNKVANVSVIVDLNKVNMPKELCNVKAGLVRRTPTTQFLVRKCLWTRNSPEEIHPPLCPLCMSTIDIEQSQRNFNLADPFLRTLV